MPFDIDDEETEQLARELSEATGQSIEEVIKTAVRERLNAITGWAAREKSQPSQ